MNGIDMELAENWIQELNVLIEAMEDADNGGLTSAVQSLCQSRDELEEVVMCLGS